MSKKLIVRLGDKVVAGLLLLFVIYQLILGLQRWMAEPELTENVAKTIDKVEKVKNKPKIEKMDFELYRELQENLKWDENLIKEPKRPLRYEHAVVNTSEEQDKYIQLLADHGGHFFFEVDGGEGRKHCAFPGCNAMIDRPPVYLGVPVEVALGEVGVMSIEFSWKEPSEVKDAKTQFCVLQRAIVKDGQEEKDFEWQDVYEEGKEGKEGNLKKIYGVDLAAKAASEESEGGAGFYFEEEAPEEKVVDPKSAMTYSYLDFNLDPSTEYAYRVRAMGVSSRDSDEVVEGQWGPTIRATTKKDQGVGFIRYLPGMRDKEGNYKKRSDGKPISVDKAYLRIRKLYDPPWSSQRYFVEYLHRNVIPGGENGQDAIGKLDSRFKVKTEAGDQVYIDKKKENFLFVNGERTKEVVDSILEKEEKNWREFRVPMDFSTPWSAVEVIEEVVEEMDQVTKYTSSGEATVVTSKVTKYRYFLLLKDKETGAEERLELEREDLKKRLRTD